MGRAGPRFEFLEAPGPFEVGFEVLEQYDASRTFRVGRVWGRRPLQTLVWYPALKGDRAPLRVRHYAALTPREISFDEPRLTRAVGEMLIGLEGALDEPLRAQRGADAAAGRFPLVLYAPSFSASAWENADLCEYLASHGYVVIASPSLGVQQRAMSDDLEGVRAQARDLRFLLGYGLSRSDVEAERGAAVVGFSWGGLANLFAAASDARVRALVALDGSLRYWSGLVQGSSEVRPHEMTIPLLYFAQGQMTLEEAARHLTQNDGPSVLNAWTAGDLTLVHMLGMGHADFSSMLQRDEAVRWKLEHVFHGLDENFGPAEAALGYAWVARYTRWFLDGTLRGEAGSLEALRRAPSRNGVPRYVMRLEHRAASSAQARTAASFREEVERQGFAELAVVYERFTCGAEPDGPAASSEAVQARRFELEAGFVCDWAEELLEEGRAAQACELLEFAVTLHSRSTRSYLMLGDARALLGEEGAAGDAYRRVIDLDPMDADARYKLHRLALRPPK